MALTDKLTNIANAIRNKTNTTEAMTLDEMPLKIESIISKVDPILQDKTIEITENGTQTITADEGYNGLNKVEITTNIASSGGGETPEIGLVPTEWNSSGQIVSGNYYGSSIASKYFYTADNFGGKTVTNVNFINPITSVGNSAFYNSNITTLKTVNIGYLGEKIFYNFKGLKQISMPNATTIYSSNTSNGAFNGCTNLKGIWIGDKVSNITQYAFFNCSAVKKMYIDLPRATVEAMTYYSNGFSHGYISTDKIICNDDEVFLTKEEFDAIDWSTYTG